MRTWISTRDRPQGQENTKDQVTIGLCVASDWLRKWRYFLGRPITLRSEGAEERW